MTCCAVRRGAARARLALALAKHGLGRADLMANLNLFKAVRVDARRCAFVRPRQLHGGAFVELRMDMDVLAVVGVGPHVLDPRGSGQAGPDPSAGGPGCGGRIRGPDS